MQLNWKHQFEFAAFYAAVHRGFYRDVGLDVHLVEGGPGIDAVREVGNYRAKYRAAEDLDLYLRLMQRYDCANLPELGLYYELNEGGISATKRRRQLISTLSLLLRLAAALPDDGPIDHAAWSAALHAGVDGVRDRGKATAGDKTMLDALVVRAREIGALAAVMGGIDGIVFTAGIGENDAATRAARRSRELGREERKAPR